VALDAPELLEDPRFNSYQNRTINVDEARQEIQGRIGKLTRQQALECLEKADVPCGPVRDVAEVMADEHFYRRGSLLPMRHAGMEEPVPGISSGFPVIFSDGPLPELTGAPTLGMHNRDIYGKLLGLGDTDLAALREQGVI
jgi:formyl-CoA transferase